MWDVRWLQKAELHALSASPWLQGKHVVCVSVGDWHNAAICQNGQLYMWGRGDCG